MSALETLRARPESGSREPRQREMLERLQRALESVDYGEVTAVIHSGKVTEIRETHRHRMD